MNTVDVKSATGIYLGQTVDRDGAFFARAKGATYGPFASVGLAEAAVAKAHKPTPKKYRPNPTKRRAVNVEGGMYPEVLRLSRAGVDAADIAYRLSTTPATVGAYQTDLRRAGIDVPYQKHDAQMVAALKEGATERWERVRAIGANRWDALSSTAR